jgi:hypothetical protein
VPMHRHHCNLEREELVSWREGTLDPRRSAELSVHIDQCPVCQQQIETAEQVDSLFQKSWPLVKDPAGERRTIAAIYGFRSSGWNGRTLAVALVLAFMLPLVGVALLWPSPTGADSGFPGLINAARSQVGHTGTGHEPLSDLRSDLLPETDGHTVPGSLPFGLALVGSESRQDGGVRLQYANPEGDLEIRVNQGDRDLWEDTLTTSDPRFAEVDGTGVVWMPGLQEDSVSALLWERYETVFAILVIVAPPGERGGLKPEEGLKIVKTFIEEQDRVLE